MISEKLMPAMFEHMIWMYFHVPHSSYWQCKYLLVYVFVTKPNHIKNISKSIILFVLQMKLLQKQVNESEPKNQ